MKATRIIAGLLIAMAVMMMIGTAAAAMVPGQLCIYGSGVTWKFAPVAENGKVVSVQPYYYLAGDPLTKYFISPVATNIGNNIVVLNFDPSQMHDLAGTVGTTGIDVTTDSGFTYVVSGPGFAFGGHTK
jgi:hypothetical protein